MRTLALLALTAAGTIAAPAIAQAQPRAGHSWGQPGRQAQRVIVREVVGAQPGMRPGMREVRQVGQVRQFQRIGRGQVVPTFWAAPQFQVRSWQAYGFPQPMQGMRWIRYYDDALLVDRGGRVMDGRYNYDWDSYGERWSRDDRGIPMYAGDGDFHPGERDYAWADEADEGGWDYAEYGDEGGGRGPGCGSCGGRDGHGRDGYAREGHGRDGYAREEGYARGGSYRREGYRHGGGYEQGGYSSGYSTGGYGYGYGYGGGTVTITETTVETGGSQVIEETVYEEVIETRARARRAAPRRAAPVRRPIRGERG